MSAPIRLPVTLDAATRRKDRSVTIRATTNLEIPTDEYAEIDRLVQQSGWLLFSPNELEDADVPTEDAPSPEEKPKGQRLRAVRYLIWKKRGIEEPFEAWYTRWFEQ